MQSEEQDRQRFLREMGVREADQKKDDIQPWNIKRWACMMCCFLILLAGILGGVLGGLAASGKLGDDGDDMETSVSDRGITPPEPNLRASASPTASPLPLPPVIPASNQVCTEAKPAFVSGSNAPLKESLTTDGSEFFADFTVANTPTCATQTETIDTFAADYLAHSWYSVAGTGRQMRIDVCQLDVALADEPFKVLLFSGGDWACQEMSCEKIQELESSSNGCYSGYFSTKAGVEYKVMTMFSSLGGTIKAAAFDISVSSNAVCDNAFALPPVPNGSVSETLGSTTGGVAESTLFCGTASDMVTPSAWYSLSTEAGYWYKLSTCGSADTEIAVCKLNS